jgi:Na+/H+ antiporter NhaD/arsenite permease-like protein
LLIADTGRISYRLSRMQDPSVLGIPVDFILFGLTLAGVAVFHKCTMRVALTGLVTIIIYKIAFTGFKTGDGVMGFISHVGHEWVILVNLLCLLMGFALLSQHFEKSQLPLALPKFLPHDWKGGFVLLVMVWVLSSFLDNIAAALIGGAMAHQLFRGKVHIGYLAGDRGRFECRWFLERTGRHDDDDDVDRRGRAEPGV